MVFIIALIAAAVALIFFFGAKKRFAKSEQTLALGGFGVAALVALIQLITMVPAGYVGVVDFFGNVSDKTLPAGVNIVNPLAKVVKFSIKTQEMKEVMSVPSKEGLTVQLEISLLFSLNPAKAGDIYKTVGDNYLDVIIVPQFRSAVRGVTSKYEARALYTSEREVLAEEIKSNLSDLVADRGVIIERAPLRQIDLPSELTRAIEEKLKAEQESQKMQFVLQREQQEADRKRIEAQGIADFQKIVSQGISEQLLKWKGIEATEKLANSNNTKVVIVGAGKDGLPVILGNN